MTQAPYAPPAADLARPQAHAPFFAVSQAKLAILSITSFSFYQLWWLYKNWAGIRARGHPVSPFWRAFFGPLFAYSLFVRLQELGAGYGLRMALWPGACAVAYFVPWLVSRTPLPWVLLTHLSVLALMPANALARRLNERLAAEADPLARWSWANVAWLLLVGGPLVGLVAIQVFDGATAAR